MIFVDSNVPMYLVGAAHPHKADAQRLLESALASGERLVTDGEVFQEILHRYVAIKILPDVFAHDRERRPVLDQAGAVEPGLPLGAGLPERVLELDALVAHRAERLERRDRAIGLGADRDLADDGGLTDGAGGRPWTRSAASCPAHSA